MRFFTAHVRNGRLLLDEPTEHPDGTLVELVSTDTVVWLVQLDERAPLVEADARQTFDLGEVLAGLRSSHTPSLKAHVQNRRLVLDEPTDLPDGTVVEIAPIDDVVASGGYFLGDQAQATLERVIGRRSDDAQELVAVFDRDALPMDSPSRKSSE